MHNLKLVKQYKFEDSTLSEARNFCVDVDKKLLYFFSNYAIYSLTLDYSQLQLCRDLLEEGLLCRNSNGNLNGIAYLFADQSLCVSVSTGEVILFNPATTQLECVGIVEDGITTMCWSPDQEIVVFVNACNTLILMSRLFDTICESAVHTDEYGENKPITVGWGSKETQFHGSEGKAAARNISEEPQGAFSADDHKVCISWRGDSQLFVVSAVTSKGSRQLRIWNREGILQYTAEPLDGLQQALSWQPTGNLIAAALCRPNKCEVIFFEKNGLCHGEIILPIEPSSAKAHLNGNYTLEIKNVMWNVNSTLLAVYFEDNDDSKLNRKSCFQIWSTNNYHWYLKQSFSSTSLGFSAILAMHWDPENAHQIHVLCTDGLYFNLTWSWTVSCSRGLISDDLGIVSVIDGYKVLVTPFRKLVIPPPLSAISLQLPKAVNHVVMAPSTAVNDILVITENNKLYLFSIDIFADESHTNMEAAFGNGFKSLVNSQQLKGVYELSWKCLFDQRKCLCFHHWVWVNMKKLLFILTIDNIPNLAVVECSLSEGNIINFTVINCIPVGNDVISICPSSVNEAEVAIELSDGFIFKFNCDNQVIIPWLKSNSNQLKLPQPCLHMSLMCINLKDHILALSDRSILFYDDFELANNCTSFFCIPDFLLFTTHDHMLHCITNLELQEVSGTMELRKIPSLLEQLRQVERGSRIVTVIPTNTKLILQMPRGNLETVHPRALVLHLIWSYLDRMQFKDALILMRRHRINMNITFDHNPELFLHNVDTFVDQVDDINLINLFISSLQVEDVTDTLYKSAYAALQRDSNKKNNAIIRKVDLVCNYILNAMEKNDADKFFLGVLTAHVKKSTPELDIALHKINALKDNKHLSQVNDGISADVALKHLLYMVDVNDLYNVALGTYNFQLVMLVAEKSQKDPKEYLPFLNSLQKLEPNYMKFAIDKHLKRFSKALQHISKCGDVHFEECLEFVKANQLYAEAVKVFPKFSNYSKTLLDAYGLHLLEQNSFNEAGIVFMKGEVYDKALMCFQKSVNWMQAFCAASKLKYSPSQIVLLAREFAGSLKAKRQYCDAAYVLEVYGKDAEESIVALIQGQEWDKSLLLMNTYQRLDITESHLFPALLESFSSITTILEMLKNKFHQYKARLAILRKQQKDNSNKNHDEDDDSHLPGSDFFSDVSTITGVTYSAFSAGSGSRFTSRTSRNKKKQDRKKTSLKEGSLFEDFALLEALSQIICQADNLKEECGSLMRSLVLHNFDTEAAKLQLDLDSLIKYMIQSKSDIWPPIESCDLESEFKLGPMSTANHIVAAAKHNLMPNRGIPPEYNVFLQPPTLKHIANWKMDILK